MSTTDKVKLPKAGLEVLRGALKGNYYFEAQMLAMHEQGRLAGLEEQGWISVEDARKPELDQVILMWVWAEDECETEEGRYYAQDVSQVQMGVYRDAGHGPYFDCFATPFADHEGVGYWKPLPPPPAAASIGAKMGEE